MIFPYIIPCDLTKGFQLASSLVRALTKILDCW